MKMGWQELLIVLVIVLVIFGPKSLPKLSKMAGKSVKSFKKGMESDDTSKKSDDDEDDDED